MYNVLFKSLLYKNVHYNKLENFKKIFHYIKESLIGNLPYIKKFNKNFDLYKKV